MKQQQRSQRHRNEGEREHVAHRGEERDADRAFRRARRSITYSLRYPGYII